MTAEWAARMCFIVFKNFFPIWVFSVLSLNVFRTSESTFLVTREACCHSWTEGEEQRRPRKGWLHWVCLIPYYNILTDTECNTKFKRLHKPVHELEHIYAEEKVNFFLTPCCLEEKKVSKQTWHTVEWRKVEDRKRRKCSWGWRQLHWRGFCTDPEVQLV